MPRRGNEMMHAYIYTQEHEALTHTHETILVVYILLGAKARSLLQILSSHHAIIIKLTSFSAVPNKQGVPTFFHAV